MGDLSADRQRYFGAKPCTLCKGGLIFCPSVSEQKINTCFRKYLFFEKSSPLMHWVGWLRTQILTLLKNNWGSFPRIN